MTQTLPQVGHEHHERLLRHVDHMPEAADLLLTSKAEDARPILDDLNHFLNGTLLPHIESAERTLYPELERLFQNRHSMTPMRHEHDEIRHRVAGFARLVTQVDEGRLTTGRIYGLRRAMFELYALLKIHLAEEEEYLRIVGKGVASDVADVLAAALDHPLFATT